LNKKSSGSRLDRKLQKYSDGFNEIFNFFLKSYRSGVLTFCGAIVEVEFDVNGFEGKNTFRKYDNGQYQMGKPIITRHPNIVKSVIIGKKSWGLWVNQWSDGIVEGTFTKRDILQEFKDKDIKIPESLLIDFENRIYNKMIKKYGKV
jgi:hypothetical protein